MQVTFVGGLDRADAAAVAARSARRPDGRRCPWRSSCTARRAASATCSRAGSRSPGFARRSASAGGPTGSSTSSRPSSWRRRSTASRATTSGDPIGAGRGLLIDLVTPFAERSGVEGVVEHSYANLVYAPILERLFPESRFVHAVRDGREAAIREGEVRTAGELLAALDRWAAGPARDRRRRARARGGRRPTASGPTASR